MDGRCVRDAKAAAARGARGRGRDRRDADPARRRPASCSAGELVAVVGPNGAGKSTLVRAVSGLQKPSAGSVSWSGREVGEMRGRELARLRAFVPQRMPVPAGVTVREAVTIGRSSHLRPLRPADRRRPRRGSSGRWSGPRVTRFAERDADDALRRRAAAGPDRDRAGPGGAGADRRRADLPARPRRHDRRRRPAARASSATAWRCCWSSTTWPWRPAVADTVVVVSEGRTVATGAAAAVLTTRAPGRGLGGRRAPERARRPHRSARRLVAAAALSRGGVRTP